MLEQVFWSKLPQTLSETLSQKAGRVSCLTITWRHLRTCQGSAIEQVRFCRSVGVPEPPRDSSTSTRVLCRRVLGFTRWTSGGVFVFVLVALRGVDLRNVRDGWGSRSRPRGVDSAPGEGGSEGVRAAPKLRTSIHLYGHPDVRHVQHPEQSGCFGVGRSSIESRESIEIGPPAGRRPILSSLEQNPAEIRPGNPISGQETLLRIIE